MKTGFHPLERRTRARGAKIFVGALVAVLGLAFFRAQIIRGDAYALQSDSNRLRPLPVEAPRGTLFDRNRRIVAE